MSDPADTTPTGEDIPREDRVYMDLAEELLNRDRTTIRSWERKGILPSELLPHRDGQRWRFWTRDQIDGIKAWIEETGMYPGRNLARPDRSPEEAAAHIEKLRQPRSAA